MGVGTPDAEADVDADARSTRASLEVETSKMQCESQRRRERIGVCILSPLRRSAYDRLSKDAVQRRNLVYIVKGS